MIRRQIIQLANDPFIVPVDELQSDILWHWGVKIPQIGMKIFECRGKINFHDVETKFLNAIIGNLKTRTSK
jgi:hypothetical protein